MLTLKTIEEALVASIKARDMVAVETLRGLKTRIQNEQIKLGTNLSEAGLLTLVQSEIKRRSEAVEMYISGNRPELAEKETLEMQVLQTFLPKQAEPEEISAYIEDLIQSHKFTQADFGKAMGLLKQHFGFLAQGSVLSQILKEKLKS